MQFSTHLLHIARQSGPAPDNAWAIRLISELGWRRTLLLRYLRLRFSPDALRHVRALVLPLDERGRLFSLAISQVNVHETFKTTGEGRTRLADEAIVRRSAEFERVRLLDVGVSDGTASLALLERLRNLGEVVLADRHVELFARGPRALRIFLDGERRLLGVKVLGFYLNLSLERTVDPSGFETIATVNPIVQQRHRSLTIRPFNVARDVLKPPATIIKCANLLNRSYFRGELLRNAAANLGMSLVDGGYLCISQNHPRYPEGEAYLLLQRQGQRLALVEEQGGHEALEALGPLPLTIARSG